MIDGAEDGQWMDTKPLALVFKHVVHSVILKLAYGRGFSKWFYDHDRKGVIIRQSSNFVSINLIFVVYTVERYWSLHLVNATWGL